MKSISLKQRRFLIVWCCVHIFAFTVNLLNLTGELPTIERHDDIGNSYTRKICLLTSDRGDGGFWPFVKFYQKDTYTEPGVYYGTYLVSSDPATGKSYREDVKVYFNGIFYSYYIVTFIIYMVLGFAFVFIPILWGKNEDQEEVEQTEDQTEV